VAHGALVERSSEPGGRRRFSGRPSTAEGRRALWLVAGGLALIPFAALLVQVIHLPSALGALGALGMLAIAVGGVFAVVALVRRGERSIFVFVTALAGLLAVFFVIGELAFPH